LSRIKIAVRVGSQKHIPPPPKKKKKKKPKEEEEEEDWEL
jgi:hypothetical protein